MGDGVISVTKAGRKHKFLWSHGQVTQVEVELVVGEHQHKVELVDDFTPDITFASFRPQGLEAL